MRLSQKQIILLVNAALVITTLIAYEPIRHNGFVTYDDGKYIYENPMITGGISLQSLGEAFTKPHAGLPAFWAKSIRASSYQFTDSYCQFTTAVLDSHKHNRFNVDKRIRRSGICFAPITGRVGRLGG
jgi:hypothetical protein